MEKTKMNEKSLTRTEAEYEKTLAERDKLQAELERLTRKEKQKTHYYNNLVNRAKDLKRRQRTSRLIQRGALLESFIPDAESYTNEQIGYMIKLAFGNLPGGVQGIHFPATLGEKS